MDLTIETWPMQLHEHESMDLKFPNSVEVHLQNPLQVMTLPLWPLSNLHSFAHSPVLDSFNFVWHALFAIVMETTQEPFSLTEFSNEIITSLNI